MKSIDIPHIERLPGVHAEKHPDGIDIIGATYRLRFGGDRYVALTDAAGEDWTALSACSNLHTAEVADATLQLQTAQVETADDGTVTVRQAVDSTAWETKQRVWTCHDDVVQMYEEVTTSEPRRLTDITLLGGDYTAPNASGFFPSKADFAAVFNPQPDILERRLTPAYESTLITTNGMWVAGRAREFNVPTPWCFGLTKAAATNNEQVAPGVYLMAGVAAPIDEQNFTEVKYDPRGDGWALGIYYEGHTTVTDNFRTPSVLLHFADDPYEGLADYVSYGRRFGLIEQSPIPTLADWHAKSMFCGWGEQIEQARLSGTPRTRVSAADLANQAFYDHALEQLESHGVWPHTIMIDDKWQSQYGLNVPDTDKWPDMAGWIRDQHELGRRVLLWMRMWSPDGLPPELCVQNAAGVPVSSDPSNPDFLALLDTQVTHMLSPDGLDADGLKVDFLAQTPTGPTLHAHGSAWGATLLHTYLKRIHTTATAIKPDALIISHSPSPSFADVGTMSRFNDINDKRPVIPQMLHRLHVAEAALPHHLYDTDNWPMPNRKTWRDYIGVQRLLGVPALYYATHVAGEPLEPRDYAALRELGFTRDTSS